MSVNDKYYLKCGKEANCTITSSFLLSHVVAFSLVYYEKMDIYFSHFGSVKLKWSFITGIYLDLGGQKR